MSTVEQTAPRESALKEALHEEYRALLRERYVSRLLGRITAVSIALLSILIASTAARSAILLVAGAFLTLLYEVHWSLNSLRLRIVKETFADFDRFEGFKTLDDIVIRMEGEYSYRRRFGVFPVRIVSQILRREPFLWMLLIGIAVSIAFVDNRNSHHEELQGIRRELIELRDDLQRLRLGPQNRLKLDGQWSEGRS